jgi:hypothetical protein
MISGCFFAALDNLALLPAATMSAYCFIPVWVHTTKEGIRVA